MNKIFCVTTVALLFVFSCSQKYVPKYSSVEEGCECLGNQVPAGFGMAKEVWMSNRSDGFRRVTWEEFFEKGIKNDWNKINLRPIGTNEYRLSQIGSFGRIMFTSIKLKDTTTLVSIKLFDPKEKKQLVSFVEIVYLDTLFLNVDKRMDSLFWNEPFESPNDYPVHDGTAYLIEGSRSKSYKLISRRSGNIEFSQPLLDQFINLDFLLASKFECGKVEMECD